MEKNNNTRIHTDLHGFYFWLCHLDRRADESVWSGEVQFTQHKPLDYNTAGYKALGSLIALNSRHPNRYLCLSVPKNYIKDLIAILMLYISK